MTVASAYSSQVFTVSYYEKLPRGGAWLGDLDIEIQNWRHSISAFGGFDIASFEISENQNVIEDWIENGLFRPIIVYDNFLDVIWEGFVDRITINQSGLAVSIGPVTNLANRVRAIYSGVDTTVYPPQIGVRKQTPIINNIGSQIDWGIWWEILSMAGVTDSNADQLVDLYLVEHGHPEIGSNFSFQNEEISLTVSCSGWYHVLSYPFNHTEASGDVSISERIKQVLNASPNSGWISSDQTQITNNASLIPLYENDNQLAIEHIRGVTAMGDGDGNRHLFGIYESRKPFYQPASSALDYIIELGDPKREIVDIAGSLVFPWKLRPGKWIFFSDFISSLGTPFEDLHSDPRMLRVESVQFDLRTPYAVQFTGGISSRYEERSARLGLRGMEV